MTSHPDAETRKLAEQAAIHKLALDAVIRGLATPDIEAKVYCVERACQSAAQAARREALEWIRDAMCVGCRGGYPVRHDIVQGWVHWTVDPLLFDRCHANAIRQRLAALSSSANAKTEER